MTEQARTRYSWGAMLLHWAIAIAVIVNWRIAETAEHLAEAERGAVMSWHFQLGMAILILTVLRIVWRLIHKPPPLASHLATWERLLAKATHSVFYILLVSLPLLGWIGMSGYDSPVPFFGLFEWPVLPTGLDPDTGHEVLEIHATLGTAMLLLIALHILGALKHTLFDRDGNLFRMLPFGRPKA